MLPVFGDDANTSQAEEAAGIGVAAVHLVPFQEARQVSRPVGLSVGFGAILEDSLLLGLLPLSAAGANKARQERRERSLHHPARIYSQHLWGK